jgi:hypothetical protein
LCPGTGKRGREGERRIKVGDVKDSKNVVRFDIRGVDLRIVATWRNLPETEIYFQGSVGLLKKM